MIWSVCYIKMGIQLLYSHPDNENKIAKYEVLSYSYIFVCSASA